MGLAALLLVALALAPDIISRRRGISEVFFSTQLGSIFFGALLIVFFGEFSLGLAWIVLLAIFLAQVYTSIRLERVLQEHEIERDFGKRLEPIGWFECFCLAVIAAVLLCGLVNAIAPPTGWDATVAHLSLPKQYALVEHIFVYDGNTYTGYPHLLHGYYTLAYQLGGAQGVGLISLFLSMLAIAVAFELTRQLANDAAGYAAAAMIATAPLFFDQAGVASLDIAFGAVVTASLCLLLRAIDKQYEPEAWMGGALAGLSVGIRHMGILVSLLLLVVLAVAKPKRKVFSKFLGTCLFFMALVLALTYIRTGNPVYPFLSGWFPTPHLTNFPTGGFGGHESIREWSLLGFLTFPIQLGLLPDKFDGINASPGIFAIPLGLAALLLGGKRVRLVAGMGVAGILILYGLQHYARYAWPFFVLLICSGATLLAPKTRFALTLRWLAVPGLLFGLAVGMASVSFKVPVVLGLESEADYLHRRVERYAAFEWVNENILHEHYEHPFLSLDIRGYYLDAIVFQNYAALTPLQGLPVAEQAAWLHEQNLRHVLYPVAYVEESGGLVAMGYAEQFRSWLESPEYFEVIHTLETPRRGGDGTETVHILAIRGVDELP